ncbi:MAG: hypothetical protein HFE48_06150 [Clostridia bacterium]|nr:hypothetical protein [Clostridia bacterium]
MRKNPYLLPSGQRASRIEISDYLGGADFVHDESAVNAAYASKYKNFRIREGVLTDGWGIEECTLLGGAADVKYAWLYKKTEDGGETVTPMYCDGSGRVHAVKGGKDEILDGITARGTVSAADYRLYGTDVSLICSSVDGMAVYDGETARMVESSPKITSMALHYERLFVTSADAVTSVRFSDDLDPTNWSQSLDSGGFVELADGYGKSNKVVAFLNYVYIFRDYGISRMIAYADQSEFSVSNLYVSAGRIYPSSVAVCGDKVIFLSDGGLNVFDGLSTAPVLKSLGSITPKKDGAVGYWADGKYFLAYSSGGEKNDRLLVYDTLGGNAEISEGFEISSFVGCGTLAAVSQGRAVTVAPCGAAFGTPTKKVWRVPLGSIGKTDRMKTLESASLHTATDMELKIICDGRTRTFRLKGGANMKTVKIGMRGRRIGAEISSCGTGTRISGVTFALKT